MIRDAQTNLYESAALAGAGTTVSTNTYDLGAPPVANAPANDVAEGLALAVILCVIVGAVQPNGNETYEFDLITSAAPALTSPTILAKYAFTNAQVVAGVLAAGVILALPLPPGLISQRYFGLQSILGGTAPAITVTAWIAPLNYAELKKIYGTKIVIL